MSDTEVICVIWLICTCNTTHSRKDPLKWATHEQDSLKWETHEQDLVFLFVGALSPNELCSRDYWIYFDITWKRSKNSEFWEKVPRIGTCLSGKFSPATGVSFAVDFLWFPETRSQAQWNDIRFVWTIDMFFLYWDPRTCLFFPKKIDYTTTSSNNYGQAVM